MPVSTAENLSDDCCALNQAAFPEHLALLRESVRAEPLAQTGIIAKQTEDVALFLSRSEKLGVGNVFLMHRQVVTSPLYDSAPIGCYEGFELTGDERDSALSLFSSEAPKSAPAKN